MKIILEKWKAYSQDCTNADGDNGTAVVKKTNSDNIESCHSSLEMAEDSVKARNANYNKKSVEEVSSVGGVVGHVDNKEEIQELLSTSGALSNIRIKISNSDLEHRGHVERSKHQGLRNVMEDDDTQPIQGEADDSECEGEWVKWKLQDFADIPRNASRVFDVFKDIESNIGLEKLKNAVMNDLTAPSRVKVMSTNFGYDPNLLERIKNDDTEAVKKYYQFVINEFLFWIAYNPMSSAAQYAMRCTLLSKPTKNLAYGLISNYVLNPNKYNPKAKGKGMSSQADFYKLDKDLEPALYELPEE